MPTKISLVWKKASNKILVQLTLSWSRSESNTLSFILIKIGVKLTLNSNINKNPTKDSYSIRSRHCNESAIEERVSKSQIILSCTCEDYRKGSQGGGTCEKSRIWRIIKGVNLLNDIKDLKTVRNWTFSTFLRRKNIRRPDIKNFGNDVGIPA